MSYRMETNEVFLLAQNLAQARAIQALNRPDIQPKPSEQLTVSGQVGRTLELDVDQLSIRLDRGIGHLLFDGYQLPHLQKLTIVLEVNKLPRFIAEMVGPPPEAKP